MKLLLVLDYDIFKDSLLETAKRAAPYCDKIWFRIKGHPDKVMYDTAVALRAELPDSTLLLSQRADIAHSAGFDGVHLNSSYLSPDVVKRVFPDLIVGYSSHSEAECIDMLEKGADYVTLSPIFETKKSFDYETLGAIPSPGGNVYALGGIDITNVLELKPLGYTGVAGVSFVNDIEEIGKLL